MISRAFLLLLLLALPCHATMRTVTISGNFTQERGIEFWQTQRDSHLALELPVPFVFTCSYDDAMPDEDEDITRGVFTTPYGWTTLSFGDRLSLGYGDFYFAQQGTEVRVYHAWPIEGAQLWGFGCGVEDEFEAYGLFVPSYFLYFANFQYFFPTTTGDGLDQIPAQATAFAFRYVFIDGVCGDTEVLLQTGSDLGTFTLSP